MYMCAHEYVYRCINEYKFIEFNKNFNFLNASTFFFFSITQEDESQSAQVVEVLFIIFYAMNQNFLVFVAF